MKPKSTKFTDVIRWSKSRTGNNGLFVSVDGLNRLVELHLVKQDIHHAEIYLPEKVIDSIKCWRQFLAKQIWYLRAMLRKHINNHHN